MFNFFIFQGSGIFKNVVDPSSKYMIRIVLN